MTDGFHYYMHDGPSAFRFELAGALSAKAARELEQARRAASSTMGGRSLIVDLSYVTETDDAGLSLLRDWRERGAQFIATRSPASAIVESVTGRPPADSPAIAQGWTWRPIPAARRRAGVISAAILAVLLAPAQGLAADLRPETVAAWDQYLKLAGERNQKRLMEGGPFLSSDASANDKACLRSGEILISPAGPHVPLEIPSGLIHDWVGAVFIPDVTLSDVLSVVRDYGAYKKVYAPNIVDSRTRLTDDMQDRFSVVIMNKSLFTKTALDVDFRTSFACLDKRRCYSVSEATRIQEIGDYGSASSRLLPEDHGSGLIWRLHSVARFEETDSGVYIELESTALSRDIPSSVRWLVGPIVRRTSRSSMETALRKTAAAAREQAKDGAFVSTGAVPAGIAIHSLR